jgi:hypothetical protein
MKNIVSFMFLLFLSLSNSYSQTSNLSHPIVSHFYDDGFMNFKFGENIEEVKNKLKSIEGIEFVKTINGGLLYSSGEIGGELVESWEIFFANDKFAGLRLCFIDRNLFAELEESIKNKYGEYTDKQEVGPVIYISENGKKMHDVILSWYLSENAIELEEKVDGIGAFQTKVCLTYANMKLASQLNLN